ncbi:MAG TPA: HAMP domain-containing sensor histidine kinase [Ktedonobacterales bacterium]|nr:HAMP domain-containing sensor histidine kinase [Ktedonobacterales bacterium]
MTERWRSWWLKLDWWRALAETLAIQAALSLLIVLLVHSQPRIYVARGLIDLIAVIGPGCLLWCAFRMRPARVSWWRRLILDIFSGAALAVIPVAIFMGIAFVVFPPAARTRLEPPPYVAKSVVYYSVIVCGCIGGYVVSRIGVRILIFWNRLRRTHLLWSLTHAHLLVVAFGAAFMALAITGTDAVLTGTVPFTILPILVVMLIMTVIVLLFVLPPSALFSFLFARRITRRLRALTEATDRVRAGDYITRVPVSGEDEVAQLQANFNAMAADLDRTVHELQDERDNVSRLLEARRELIASVSHELRTPIATLRSYLESSREHWDAIEPEVMRRDLAVMERQTIHLQTLINDLFTLARAEVGRLDMRCEPQDVAMIATRVVNTFAPLGWQRGRVQVVAEVCPHAPRAMADGRRLEQVLQNLLHNGIRHTPPGGIVAVRVDADEQSLVIQVKDTGEGIAADDLPRIFERFYRSDATRANPDSGSGLGLTLVKELTEAMGGSVAAESTLGQGSCFTIRLPRAPSVETPPTPRQTNPRLTRELPAVTMPGARDRVAG